ncbi:MAG: preprotein translocase subunit SecA [Verrucomicrobia bacterium RIFCSPLOWO2_12_FULL_64_8]|nr:MAG: preprotein translocase subunit SecA [Verrucomicrobia bacterium RIFCSPLOWO2_12_FULL_64_8]
MISWLLKKFSGRHYRKFLERCRPVVTRINEFEQSYQSLSDEQLRAKTDEFRARFKAGETLNQLLPEAFAAVKNTARRLLGRQITVCEHELTWDMVHYDVQLIGGVALHEGKIAEMATGEGKTLVATLPLYLNALSGRNAQLVTANDYLARRDAEWMGYIYNFLGVSVGCIQQLMHNDARREMYNRDITYGTASEFGFDYLRDNGMATRKEDQVQRDHFYCIVDEVDSILVDEARTPLIISGPAPIEREQPFTRLKPQLEQLVNDQTRLCNRFVTEAREVLEKAGINADDRQSAIRRLLQVKMGHPKNKQLLRLMEHPEWRKHLDKVETEMNSDLYKEELFRLKEELYYVIDERQHQADLTEIGRTRLRPDDPDAFVMPDLATEFSDLEKHKDLAPEEKEKRRHEAQLRFETTSEEIHSISQLLRAYSLYERDVEYVVQDGKVMIVDENTGRVMPGRRWSDGLHQAVEAKENVMVERETRTYATITIQNYFRMYEKLAGMTGTAETEASEFNEIYRLAVVVIPTNKPCIRVDRNDSIFKTRRDKFNAVVKEIQGAHERGQPVLVGTVSVESSEVLSRMLKRANITHAVLNAKFHQQEAEIVSRAGQRGSVTIATNMAGRGTDIKLGEGIPDVGGLFVIGTERHESRRIDRQLRGRCARQGDPGLSKFFLSLEDELLRIFLQGNLASRLMEGSMKEGEELEHPWLNRSIESAQKKVEQQNFSIRKRLLQYDDVLNKQREVIYGIRNGAIHSERPKEIIFEQVEEEVAVRLEDAGFDTRTGPVATSVESLVGWTNSHFPITLKVDDLSSRDGKAVLALIVERIMRAYAVKESVEVGGALGALERYVVINAIDHHWQEHLTEMEELRRSIGLRSYGQRDPLQEYKGEAYHYFEELMNNVRLQICTGLFRSTTNLQSFENMLAILSRSARMQGPENEPPVGTAARLRPPGAVPAAPAASRLRIPAAVPASVPGSPGPDGSSGEPEIQLPRVTIRRDTPKVGRNDPCPCGSGKKYKHCHGK